MEMNEAIKKISEQSYKKNIEGVECIVKPSPYVEEGYPDPSYIGTFKMGLNFNGEIPKKVKDYAISDGFIKALKFNFDQVKSTLIVNDVQVIDAQIPLKDYKLPIRLYYPIHSGTHSPCLLYFHGGGFFGGNLDVVDAFMRDICQKSGAVVCSVEYSLAPQYPFPIAHNECFRSAVWLYENANELCIDAHSIFIGGDSAGGALAHYTTERLLEDRKKVKGMVLLYPALNLADVQDKDAMFDINRYHIAEGQRHLVEPMLKLVREDGAIHTCMRHALRISQTEARMSYATPYLANLRMFPPTLLLQGEYDFFTIDSLAYAKKVQKKREDLRFVLYKGIGHAFFETIGKNPQAQDGVLEIAHFIKKYS